MVAVHLFLKFCVKWFVEVPVVDLVAGDDDGDDDEIAVGVVIVVVAAADDRD